MGQMMPNSARRNTSNEAAKNGFLKALELSGNFYGNINYVEVIIDGKTVFHSNCDKKTKFKVYDKSGNGNHLLKYNKDW